MKLIRLDHNYKSQLIEMIEEWRFDQVINKTNHSPWAIFKNDEHDFDNYLKNLELDVTRGQYVKDSVYFLLDEERNRLCGACNIRHFLSDALKESGGHIGDGIRPSERRKGYATIMVGLALKKCPELGINEVMMTCNESNIGSKKSIIRNGGVFSHKVIDEGEVEEVYFITIDKNLKITNYDNGTDFIDENCDYLKTNQYLSHFFFLDASLITKSSNTDYAIKIERGEEKLLGVKVASYPLIVFGSENLAPYLVNYLLTNNLEFSTVLGESKLSKKIANAVELIHGKKFYEHLAMDFMECRKVNGEISNELEVPTIDDLDELVSCVTNFIKDCRLNDPVDKNKIASKIDNLRIIRVDGKIACMAEIRQNTSTSYHISCVYTKDEYRGKGLARKMVASITKQIIDKGFVATLNVDKSNPITNYLYRSIGYEPVFSQSEYDEII